MMAMSSLKSGVGRWVGCVPTKSGAAGLVCGVGCVPTKVGLVVGLVFGMICGLWGWYSGDDLWGSRVGEYG